MKAILTLHENMLDMQKKCLDPNVIKHVDEFMSELKGIGLVEGLEISGFRGRYFLIDGNSWGRACRKLHANPVPNFVIWEEADFFNYLNSLLTVLSKSKAKSNRKHSNNIK